MSFPCPHCLSIETKVRGTRTYTETAQIFIVAAPYIRREHWCKICFETFTTYEISAQRLIRGADKVPVSD